MHKINFVLVTLLLVAGSCSPTRKMNVVESRSSNIDSLAIMDISKTNISGTGFFIKKADIEISNGEDKENAVAVIRKSPENEYLVSIRSKTGIEGARAYITKDTLLINDRINNQLLYGRPEALERLYNVSFWSLPLIFGDFVSVDRNFGAAKCTNGYAVITTEMKGMFMTYSIDCEKVKPVSVKIEDRVGKSEFFIKYSEFRNINEYMVPGKISVEDSRNGIVMLVELDSVEIPWDGDLEFIPGNRFEKVELK